jgi:tRNA-specific 2-thiouridylase
MSGGVDSSVAAALLKQAGYEVIGITMHLWQDKGADIARRVCQVLGLPFYYVNLEYQFKEHVVDYFCREYSRGRTPNPCIACNRYIKFQALLNIALAMGAEYLATGHYARIERRDGGYYLLKAADASRDQSYFLYTLGQRELKHLLFPVGGYRKAEVQDMATEMGLPVAQAESRELCFVPNGDYRQFLAQYLHPQPGEIVDTEDRVLGSHQGLFCYTIGQRQRLGLSAKERLYVVDMDPVRNRLIVGTEEKLFHDTLLATKINFISGEVLREPVAVAAKARYKSPEGRAIISPQGSEVQVEFSQAQRAVAPGQAVVFYQGEIVFGGGIIK